MKRLPLAVFKLFPSKAGSRDSVSNELLQSADKLFGDNPFIPDHAKECYKYILGKHL